jgi:hypothetical protein
MKNSVPGVDKMKDLRRFGLRAFLLVGCLLITVPAGAIELTGAWSTDASLCTKVFKKSERRELGFGDLSDLYGSGFIIEKDRIRGKAARCTIKSRKEDGAMLHLLAACATDIMLSSVQFSLKVIDDHSISRIFPGMPGMEVTYYRCAF